VYQLSGGVEIGQREEQLFWFFALAKKILQSLTPKYK
jgi:hypothetical protein